MSDARLPPPLAAVRDVCRSGLDAPGEEAALGEEPDFVEVAPGRKAGGADCVAARSASSGALWIPLAPAAGFDAVSVRGAGSDFATCGVGLLFDVGAGATAPSLAPDGFASPGELAPDVAVLARAVASLLPKECQTNQTRIPPRSRS